MKLLPEPGFSLILKYIGEICPMSKPTYYRGVKAGTQPRAIPITKGRVAIPNCEINRHILKLLEAASEAKEATKQLRAKVEAKEKSKATVKHDDPAPVFLRGQQ
jgi:predicted DNA-binding transcriptional regulator AlpA